MNECGITAASLKMMLSDAVFQIRQQSLSKQQRLFASLQKKIDKKIDEITEQIFTMKRNFEAEQEKLRF